MQLLKKGCGQKQNRNTKKAYMHSTTRHGFVLQISSNFRNNLWLFRASDAMSEAECQESAPTTTYRDARATPSDAEQQYRSARGTPFYLLPFWSLAKSLHARLPLEAATASESSRKSCKIFYLSSILPKTFVLNIIFFV